MTLKHRAFSAVRWTVVAAVVRTLMQLVQVAVLARLLTPEDYGLMAMVTVVLSFTNMFADMGVNSAYVQRQDVTPEQRSSLFWLNIGAGVVLSLMILTVSSLIASFFGDERLTSLLMLAASTFVLIALGQQIRMAAEKALNFRLVVLTEIASILLGFGVAVSSAFAGWGVYSLVFGAIVTTGSSSVLAWLFLANGWRPMLRFKLDDVRSFLGFGSALVANNVVSHFNRSIDLLLGGRMLAAAELGLYSIPRQIVLHIQGAVNPIITRVGFPLIAQVQKDISQVRTIYLKTLNMTASTNAPLYIGFAFFAPEVVQIILGDKWHGAIELLRILALWGFIRSTGNPVGSLLMGMGRADLSLKWNLGMLFVVPPMLWLGSKYGNLGLAWALLGTVFIMFIPGWFILVRPLCKAGFMEYCVTVLRPLLIAVLAIFPAFLISMQITNDYLHMLVAVFISISLYIGLSYFLNREWVDSMMHLFAPVSSLFKKSAK